MVNLKKATEALEILKERRVEIKEYTNGSARIKDTDGNWIYLYHWNGESYTWYDIDNHDWRAIPITKKDVIAKKCGQEFADKLEEIFPCECSELYKMDFKY